MNEQKLQFYKPEKWILLFRENNIPMTSSQKIDRMEE